jgi:hypothetical protein
MSNVKRAGNTKRFFFTRVAALAFFLILTVLGVAHANSVYVDSQKHFTIRVPDGWTAKPYNSGGVSGVTIAHGADAYVQIFLQKGIDPASFIKALSNGIEASHPGYHVTERGIRSPAAQPRMFIIGDSPETPGAPRTRVYIETFVANGFSFAIIASSSGKNAPAKDLMVDYKVSQEMIQSLTLNAMPVPASVAAAAILATAPAPAGSYALETGNAPEALSRKGQKKLAALDTAFKGGALSEEEYQTKKTALYSSDLLQQRNSALLKALNQAYQDGVLTKEEYDRKKGALATDIPPPALSHDPIPDSGAPVPKPMEVFAVKSDPEPDPLPKSWTTHTDPAGFVVNLPAAWTVEKINSSGQIVLRGTRGEEIMIWPLHLQQRELDAQGAEVLVQVLARKFDVLMPWSAVQTTQNVTRVMGLGAERSATAVLSWANAPGAPSVYFYGIEAPGEIYRDSTDSFLAILKSFHIAPDSSIGELNFVNWTDPHEGAFSVSVPQGWQVVGGAYRLSAEDARYAVVMSSPDGEVRASMGDSMVGGFTQPSQALAAAGLVEGNYQTLADGTRLEILRYNSGQQFARSYVETLISRECGNPQITSNSDRGDLAATFSQSAADTDFANGLLTAGDVSFSCMLGGRPAKGKYVVATVRMAPGFSPDWLVYRLYGYIAFAGREQEGETVLAQMLQSSKFNPDWDARQKDSANGAAQHDNDAFQQIQERAVQNISDDQRQSSERIAAANEKRRKMLAQIDRKRESSMLAGLDVADPESGTQYRISGFADYHNLSTDGYVYTMTSSDSPRPNLRDMIALR